MYRKQRTKETKSIGSNDSKGVSKFFDNDVIMDNPHSDSEAGYNYMTNHDPMNVDTSYYQMSGSLPQVYSLNNNNSNNRKYSAINQTEGNNTDDDQDGRVALSNVIIIIIYKY